jgi:enamine deaminase RidA (YjgF/YER057c/UK114 family)
VVLTESPAPGELPAAVFARLGVRLRAAGGQPVALFIYGAVAAQAGLEEARRAGLGEPDWPETWVECAACDGGPLAGVQLVVWRGGGVEHVRIGGRVLAAAAADDGARHCWLGGIRPQVLDLERPAQAQQAIGVAELALDLAGFELRDVVRTWFYNDDILAWYGGFNRARSLFYSDTPWRAGALPASTGIGAGNRAGAALEFAARACRPRNPASPAAVAREVASPLQCPAPAYGSSFSRAMEVAVAGGRWLTVSGTASIDPQGRTAHADDSAAQVDLTLDVVGAILGSRGARWEDVNRATAYWRNPADAGLLGLALAARGLAAPPVVATHAVVCRGDLRFELELDAWVPA